MASITNMRIYNPAEKAADFFNPTDFFKGTGLNTSTLNGRTCVQCLQKFQPGEGIGSINECNHVVHTKCFPLGSTCPLENDEGKRKVFSNLSEVQRSETRFKEGCLAIIGLLGIVIFGSLAGKTLQSIL